VSISKQGAVAWTLQFQGMKFSLKPACSLRVKIQMSGSLKFHQNPTASMVSHRHEEKYPSQTVTGDVEDYASGTEPYQRIMLLSWLVEINILPSSQHLFLEIFILYYHSNPVT